MGGDGGALEKWKLPSPVARIAAGGVDPDIPDSGFAAPSSFLQSRLAVAPKTYNQLQRGLVCHPSTVFLPVLAANREKLLARYPLPSAFASRIMIACTPGPR